MMCSTIICASHDRGCHGPAASARRNQAEAAAGDSGVTLSLIPQAAWCRGPATAVAGPATVVTVTVTSVLALPSLPKPGNFTG